MQIRQNANLSSWIYIIMGSVLLFFCLDIVYKLLLLILSLGLLFYGFSLRGFNSRSVMQRFFMSMFFR